MYRLGLARYDGKAYGGIASAGLTVEAGELNLAECDSVAFEAKGTTSGVKYVDSNGSVGWTVVKKKRRRKSTT